MLRRIQSEDQTLNLIQDAVTQEFQTIASTTRATVTVANGTQDVAKAKGPIPFQDGSVIQMNLATAADNLVPHGLNRMPQYWLIVRLSALATVWEAVSSLLPDSNGTPQSATTSYINLRASAPCTVSVWVS